MYTCNIDHSKEDVMNKLQSQEGFLPKELFTKAVQFLEVEHSQQILNELFHLLKKYDLAPKEEQQERNIAMDKLFQA